MLGAQSVRHPPVPLPEGNSSWLSLRDAKAMRSRLAQSECAPTPSQKGGRWQLITWQDLARYLGSYNAWVRLWNVHETDWSLSMSPDWWDGETVYSTHDVLKLRFHSGLEVEVKLRRWQHYHDGWSLCRHEAPIGDVVWARQRRPRTSRRQRIRESAGRSR
jgi:hypothetical protein